MKTIQHRNKNGRPIKEISEKKSYAVNLKMATEEYYSLKAKARIAGLSLSEFIRQCIRLSIVKQRLNSEMLGYIRQLCGMANNVNQIARKANTLGYTEVKNEWIGLANQLDKVIKKIEDDC